jgi:hypothetical protein
MTVNNFKRIPYGTSNFERLIVENYAYVDKTRFVELLENEQNPYQFFIRPRKFGKSLFLSLLSNYYDIRKAEKFEQLYLSEKTSMKFRNFRFEVDIVISMNLLC